ncbi:MAG: hypothetical protein HY851_06725, partial [candidate division Zixibacteria bacterium]|nr:hypothetical protein [candidate division Zixibacteria bacterium]
MLLPDDHSIRKTFVRIFTWAVILVAVAAIGYLVVGEPLLRYFYDGGSVEWLVPPRHADDRTFEQYARDSGLRFWSNLVSGVPLSLLVIYLLFALYRRMFRDIPPDVRILPDSKTYPAIGGALVAVAIYATATIIRYAPSLGSIDTAMIGPPEDNMACLWTLSWAHNHLFNGAATISHVSDLFYPEGSSFVFHAWSYYNLLLFWCLRQVFSSITSYNLLTMMTFPLSGLGGYCLARYLIRSHWPAVLAGFLFAFNPAHLVRA